MGVKKSLFERAIFRTAIYLLRTFEPWVYPNCILCSRKARLLMEALKVHALISTRHE